MRILFFTHSFNSLAQRLFVELSELGHEVSVELDIHAAVFEEAVSLFEPDLVVAPFLKRAIPESVWSRVPCLVVHPGIPGDRGPSALDWAILDGASEWGVTVLQANGVMDGGDVWAWRTFAMRNASKGSLYRNEVTQAACEAVLEAVEKFERGGFVPGPATSLGYVRLGRERPAVRQEHRRIDWTHDSTEVVLRKIRSGDGTPGVLDSLEGLRVRLFDAHPEATLRGLPGALVARRAGAVCRATRDGAVWMGALEMADSPGRGLKLPATLALGERVSQLPEAQTGFWSEPTTWQDVHYEERAGTGFLHFDFYNGAMGVSECERLEAALAFVRSRPVRVVLLMGGHDFWSNGIHLAVIEHAASAAEASLANIRAINRVARAILTDLDRVYVSALQGNAGSGGCFLALAADRVVARQGVILNPHYKNMGNLHGSEFWTYVLPRRVGRENVSKVMGRRLPMGTREALALGLVDAVWGMDVPSFVAGLGSELEALDVEALLRAKRERRLRDEAEKPLDRYEAEELAHMHRNFFGFDPSYHVARYNFIRKVAHSRTPLHLARHRRRGSR